MLQSEWPEPKDALSVRVLVEEATETHRFQYRSDGILAIGTDIEGREEVPAFVKLADEVPGTALLNRANRQALRHLIDQVDAMEAQLS
jgi:hypothetical protein